LAYSCVSNSLVFWECVTLWKLQDQPFGIYGQPSTAASSKQDLQHALDLFSAVCDQAGMNISTKKTEVLCLSGNSRQCMLRQVEKFTTLGWYSRVMENRTRRWIWKVQDDGLESSA